MEIIPHFWVSDKMRNDNFIKRKNIKCIIILSKYLKYNKNAEIEQIRIPIEKTDNNKNDNINSFQHLYDVTYFIFEKIYNNKNILLVGNEKDSSILYLFILAYYIRYGKLDIKNSLLYLETKIKMNYFNFHDSLFKFYNQINNKL
tara:strand:+ start:201 stop:635 length:435 start_codon:yes stop_codon:yes gene_type:complete